MGNIASLKQAVLEGWNIYQVILKTGQAFAVAAKAIDGRKISVYKLNWQRGNGGEIADKENLGIILFGYKNDIYGMYDFLKNKFALKDVREITHSL